MMVCRRLNQENLAESLIAIRTVTDLLEMHKCHVFITSYIIVTVLIILFSAAIIIYYTHNIMYTLNFVACMEICRCNCCMCDIVYFSLILFLCHDQLLAS